MAKEQRTYNGERTVSLLKVLGKLDNHMQMNERKTIISYHTKKSTQNGLKT